MWYSSCNTSCCTRSRGNVSPPAQPAASSSSSLTRWKPVLTLTSPSPFYTGFKTCNGSFMYTETDTGADPGPGVFPPDWSTTTVVLRRYIHTGGIPIHKWLLSVAGEGFSRRGANLLFDQFLSKTAWNWRNFGPGAPPAFRPPPPSRSATHCGHFRQGTVLGQTSHSISVCVNES